MASFHDEIIEQFCVDVPHSQVHTCLETLSKIMLNVIENPSNPKFRRLRPVNATLARTVFAFPQAELLLTLFGFVESVEAGETVFVLPEGVTGAADVAKSIATKALKTAPAAAGPAVAPLVAPSANPAGEDARKAALEASRIRLIAEEKERQRQRALIAEDRAARAERMEATVIRTSIAVPRLGHGSATTYKDVGVDLCKKGG